MIAFVRTALLVIALALVAGAIMAASIEGSAALLFGGLAATCALFAAILGSGGRKA